MSEFVGVCAFNTNEKQSIKSVKIDFIRAKV